MNTKIFTKNELSEAAAMIRNGGIVVMPTETVYGLAANAFDAEAVEKVFAAKGRQADNPLIVHIANNSDWEKLVEEIPPKARQLADRFWPGPLTIILKKKPIVPDIVSGGLDTVAVRMPKNKIAFRFIRECGCPLAAPSANLSGCPSPTKLSHVMKDMNGRVDGIIEGGDCMVGLESTVISLAGDKPVILRPGRITAAQISKVIGEVEIHPAVTNDLTAGEKAASPGMKYKHYAPNAAVTIIDGSEQEYIDFIKSNADDKTAVICFSEMLEKLEGCNTFLLGESADSVAQSKRLFDVLRAVDDASLEKAYAPMPSAEGVGLAVTNRLLRAAGFNVIKLNAKETRPAPKKEKKEEKPTLTTKKAVKDKKPDIKPPKPEKVKEDIDDDVVQVIGLGENNDFTGIKSEVEAPKAETNKPESQSEIKENKGKKHKKKNKKKQKLQQEKKSENAEANIPDSKPDNNKDEPDFVVAQEKPVKKESETDDSTIEALKKLKFSPDLNIDPDENETPGPAAVTEPEEEEENPINMVSDLVLKGDDIIMDVNSPVIEEAAQEVEIEYKEGFFRKLFNKRAQKYIYQPEMPGTFNSVNPPETEKQTGKENAKAKKQKNNE